MHINVQLREQVSRLVRFLTTQVVLSAGCPTRVILGGCSLKLRGRPVEYVSGVCLHIRYVRVCFSFYMANIPVALRRLTWRGMERWPSNYIQMERWPSNFLDSARNLSEKTCFCPCFASEKTSSSEKKTFENRAGKKIKN